MKGFIRKVYNTRRNIKTIKEYKKKGFFKTSLKLMLGSKFFFIMFFLCTLLFIFLITVVLILCLALVEINPEFNVSIDTYRYSDISESGVNSGVNRGLPADDEGTRFYYPVARGVITSYYGLRIDPVTKSRSFHTGLDIAPGNVLTEIYPARPGEVVLVSECSVQPSYISDNISSGLCPQKGYGNTVIIKHELKGGVVRYTRYAHMYKILVEEGQKVGMNDVIGYVGNTGKSTGPHLHFEIKTEYSGNTVNPLTLLYCGDNKISGDNFSNYRQTDISMCFKYRKGSD